jgi:LacI family transcriptional regulator
MTVSRVINDEKNVRSTTRDSVLASIDALGYSPNQAARSLAGADTIHVGILYDNPRTTYVSTFLIGGLQQTSLRNVQLVVMQSQTPREAEMAIDRFAASGIDGVILPPPLSDWMPVVSALDRHDIPTVLVATGRPHSTCSAVGIDDYLASRAMVEHLLDLGHERIGFIAGDPNQEASQRRLEGYRDILDERGFAVDESLIAYGMFTFRSGVDSAERLLDQEPRPTAIFASNDDMAAAAIAVAERSGLDVPRDLTVCGFDDTPIAERLLPELTTIRQPIEEMSRQAVDHLITMIRARREGEHTARQHIVLDYELVRRHSDAPPSAPLRTTVS